MSPYRGVASQSPHSSTGQQDSIEGTPDTSLTAFSPEEVRSSRPSHVSSIGDTTIGTAHHDPFVTAAVEPRTLSATASSFQPGVDLNSTKSSTAPAPTPVKTTIANQPAHGGGSYLGSVSPGAQIGPSQFGTFSTETGASRYLKISGIYDAEFKPLVEASLQNARNGHPKPTGTLEFFLKAGVVYLRLSNINEASHAYTTIKMENPGLAVEYVSAACLAQATSDSPSKQSSQHSSHDGQVVLNATYPALAAVNKKEFEEGLRKILEAHGQLFAWQKMSATEAGNFSLIAEFCDTHKAKSAVKKCNGMYLQSGVTLSVQAHHPDLSSQNPTPPQATPTRRPGEKLDLSEAMGCMSLRTDRGQPYNASTDPFRSPAQTPTSLQFMSPNPFGLSPAPPMGSFYAPHPIAAFQQAYLPPGHPQTYGSGNETNPFSMSPYSHSSYEHGPYGSANLQQISYGNELGYYGQVTSSLNLSPPYERPTGRRQNAVKVPHHHRGRVSNSVAAHHNHVDINRIQQGIDVRTTVMLRNIPNKLDQAQLKAIIDESSFGKYDFMYLRIDFSNNCNVGYAFINFNDPLDIIDFVRARSGEKWHRFKSDKVAEVSYATIQGKDCLVQKFRNSSVMLEPPHYRPKLYRTFTDHFGHIGEEEQFPDSDNASKLKRSCENAEHVGLFAPNAGQHVRDEQRRRRSQYDRGTSLAEREESGYEGYDEDYSSYSTYGYPPY